MRYWRSGTLVTVVGKPPGYEFLDGALCMVNGLYARGRTVENYSLVVIRDGVDLQVSGIPRRFLRMTSPLEELARADV